MEDLADEEFIKELNNKNMSEQDFILKELLPKISVNQDDKNNYLNYKEILEKNLKLNQAKNWLTDSLDEHTYGEKSPTNEPLSPFGGRTGVFKPINSDKNNQSGRSKLDLLTGADKNYENFSFSLQNKNLQNRNETMSPNNYYLTDNIEGIIEKKENNVITGNIDIFKVNNKNVNNVQDNLLKRQEDKLIEKLENELMNEKLKQNDLLKKKHEIEKKQIEHELELGKTKKQLLDQQNLFQEQQQLLQNQRQELQIERWRMEQEKQQLMHQHEMNIKKEQLDQQQVLNQKLEQQKRNFEQQLQNQKIMQQKLQNELEHQKQLQIKNQKQSILNNQASMLKQQQTNQLLNEQQKQIDLINSISNNNQQQQIQNEIEQQLKSQKMNQQLQNSQKFSNNQLSPNNMPNNKKFHLNSPLQSLQSLLPQSLQSKSYQANHQNQLQQTSQINLNSIEPPKNPRKHPSKHRLVVQEDDSLFSAFKPPMHSNSKLNSINSPKNSFFAIDLISSNIPTDQQRPVSPRPSFNTDPSGLLSSNSSLTRQRPVGFSNSFNNQQQLNKKSQDNFYDSFEFEQSNKSNQYFGSGSKLNNLNRSTGSLHMQERLISTQQQHSKLNNLNNQLRPSGNNRLNEYDHRQYSSHNNLNQNFNNSRRNSAMGMFYFFDIGF